MSDFRFTTPESGKAVITFYEKGAAAPNPVVTVKYVLTTDSAVPQGYTLPADVTAHPGDTVTLAEKPSIPGYTFDGWKRYAQYDTLSIPTNDVNDGDIFEVEGKFTEQQAQILYKIEDDTNDQRKGHISYPATGYGTFKVVTEKNKLSAGATVEGQETYTTKYVFTHWTMKLHGDDTEYPLVNNPTARNPHIEPLPEDDPGVTDGIFTDRTYYAHFQEVVTQEYEIIITGNSATATYNGEPHSVNGYTVSAYDESITLTGPAQNDAKVSLTETNAGTYTMTMAAGDFTATSEKYENIKITVVPGTLTVDKVTVTITTGSDSKAYDGTALTNSEAGITGLVNGETATVTATGSQIEVGSSNNNYSIDWGTTNKDNYTISESLGTLTVTENAAEVTVGQQGLRRNSADL